MRVITSSIIRATVQDLYKISDQNHWEEKLKDTYGLKLEMAKDVHDGSWITRQICDILKPISPELIKACGVKKLEIRTDMGPNLPHYPGHGWFRESDRSIALNADIFYHPDMPDDFYSPKSGEFTTRSEETFLHEIGHSADHALGDVSLKPEWMKLSGWSKTYRPGLKRLEIKEKGAPEVIGEMWFNPSASFTRFYAKRNSYDDFADTFAYYFSMKDKVPPAKKAYFDKLLKKYI